MNRLLLVCAIALASCEMNNETVNAEPAPPDMECIRECTAISDACLEANVDCLNACEMSDDACQDACAEQALLCLSADVDCMNGCSE